MSEFDDFLAEEPWDEDESSEDELEMTQRLTEELFHTEFLINQNSLYEIVHNLAGTIQSLDRPMRKVFSDAMIQRMYYDPFDADSSQHIVIEGCALSIPESGYTVFMGSTPQSEQYSVPFYAVSIIPNTNQTQLPEISFMLQEPNHLAVMDASSYHQLFSLEDTEAFKEDCYYFEWVIHASGEFINQFTDSIQGLPPNII